MKHLAVITGCLAIPLLFCAQAPNDLLFEMKSSAPFAPYEEYISVDKKGKVELRKTGGENEVCCSKKMKLGTKQLNALIGFFEDSIRLFTMPDSIDNKLCRDGRISQLTYHHNGRKKKVFAYCARDVNDQIYLLEAYLKRNFSFCPCELDRK